VNELPGIVSNTSLIFKNRHLSLQPINVFKRWEVSRDDERFRNTKAPNAIQREALRVEQNTNDLSVRLK